ncbi:recombinase family protein [Streptomyces cinerochromogenes]|uniref:Recombinase family protein n=1 Tax=Streptomyces cinerochromogenes TaxID=66422 RepID=A0ABW7B9N0_9ACTN
MQTVQGTVDALAGPDVVRLWRALLGCADRANSPEDLIDPHRRGAPFCFQQMDAPRPRRNRVHVDIWVPYGQAEARIAAAAAAGGRVVSDAHAPSHWVLADPEDNEACVGTAGWIGPDARPELKACHAFLEPGDTLVVPSLDRYGPSLQDLVNMVAVLRTRGIGFTSLHERPDTLTPGGRLIFHVFAALAEFIRELIVQGTNEGLAAARARGRVGGRPTVVSEQLLRAARDMLPNPENSIETIAKLLGVSVGTLYNHIPELKELRTSRVPSQLTGGSR